MRGRLTLGEYSMSLHESRPGRLSGVGAAALLLVSSVVFAQTAEFRYEFDAPSLVRGDPGGVVRVPVDLVLVAEQPMDEGWSSSIRVRSDEVTLRLLLEDCDFACAADRLGLRDEEVFFFSEFRADPEFFCKQLLTFCYFYLHSNY